MRRIVDPDHVIEAVALVSGVPVDVAAARVRVFRDCVDELLADGYSLAAWPLYLAHPGDPVARRFADWLPAATEEQLVAVDVGDSESVAQWLDVDLALVDQHPIAGHVVLLIRIFDRLGVDEKRQPDEVASLERSLNAWLDSFAEGRRYRMSAVGLERDLEAWLVRHPDVLTGAGYPVALERTQWVLPDRRRPDLVCRFTEPIRDANAGDWLIVELKAGAASIEAVDQLEGYVEAFRANVVAPGELVVGVLIADGLSPGVRQHLDAAGLGFRSLSSIGYREVVGRSPSHPDGTAPPPVLRTVAAPDGTAAAAPRRLFTLHGHDGNPSLVLEAASLTAPVVAVHPARKVDLTPAMAVKAREVSGPYASVLDLAAALGTTWDDIRATPPGFDHTALDSSIYGAELDPVADPASAPTAQMATYSISTGDGPPLMVLEAAGPHEIPTRIWAVAAPDLASSARELAQALPERATCMAILSRMGAYAEAVLVTGDPLSGYEQLTEEDDGELV